MFAGVLLISLVGFMADRFYVMAVRRILVWQS